MRKDRKYLVNKIIKVIYCRYEICRKFADLTNVESQLDCDLNMCLIFDRIPLRMFQYLAFATSVSFYPCISNGKSCDGVISLGNHLFVGYSNAIEVLSFTLGSRPINRVFHLQNKRQLNQYRSRI